MLPVNTSERFLCSVFMVISGMIWTYVLGTTAGIASTLDPNGVLFQTTMDALNMFMRERQLPRAMRRQLRSFFDQSRRVREVNDDTLLLTHMSPLLQGTVAKKKGAKKDKAAEATYDVSRYAPPIKRHVEELLGAGLSVGDGAATHPQCTQLAMPFPVRGAPHSGDGIVCADCRWASSPS